MCALPNQPVDKLVLVRELRLSGDLSGLPANLMNEYPSNKVLASCSYLPDLLFDWIKVINSNIIIPFGSSAFHTTSSLKNGIVFACFRDSVSGVVYNC